MPQIVITYNQKGVSIDQGINVTADAYTQHTRALQTTTAVVLRSLFSLKGAVTASVFRTLAQFC